MNICGSLGVMLLITCFSHGVLLELGVRTGATAFTCTVKLSVVVHIKAVSLGLLSLLQYTSVEGELIY